MKTIGILSDTHRHLTGAAYEALSDCDHIIHAGDIGDPVILTDLEQLAPVTAVLGNNDYSDDYPAEVTRTRNEEIFGLRFLIGHYPSHVNVAAGATKGWAPGDPVPDICVHGHTHFPEIHVGARVAPAKMLICPGSTTRPRQGSPATLAKLLVDEGDAAAGKPGRLIRAHIITVVGGYTVHEWISD